MIGQSVAHYKVTTKIGAGGMGEVFRATDSRLNRDVALKFLPEQFATDPHRMARFNREAQVLASLSHPNIGAIYGLEQSNGRTALVMELIEGEDLSERMRRGPIPLEESLKIARQIAEALEAAHEKGIIHRDLKPANIKLTPDGQVKVLDFGLAKALEDPSMSSMSGGGEVSQSPTLSIAATKAGIILGTAAYMSPEQASGLPADKRCDVWSFGVVLYEMLVGRRLFTGETVSHTLADVLRADIDFTKLPATTPSSIRKLLERCLDRDKKRRLRDIGEARIVIDDYLAGTVSSGTRRMAAPVATQPAWQRVLPWTIAGFATALLLAAGFMLWRQPAPPQAQSMNIDAKISTDRFWSDIGSGVELSPDGSIIAFIVGTGDRRQLKIRRIDQLDSTVLVDGTSDAVSPYHPFFSPDGKWLGYATSTELRKIPISGGTPLTLCKVSRSRGATWLADDTIVFAPNPASALFRVPASGGEPKALTTIDTKAGEMHRWPQALPGGEAVLFNTLKTLSANANTFDDGIIEVVKLATGERKVIHRGGGYARYLPTGQLVYVNKGTLFGLPFDLKRLEVKGTPAPLVQNITWNAPQGAAQLSFSTSGLLAYVRGAGLVPKYPVVWADRNGNTSQLINEPGTYANPRLSPDGKQVAMSVYRDGNWDIWVYDLARSISTRLTFSESLESEQIWSPDGKYVIYSSRSGGPDNLFRKRADGSGGEEQLTKADVGALGELVVQRWAFPDRHDGRRQVRCFQHAARQRKQGRTIPALRFQRDRCRAVTGWPLGGVYIR